MQVQYLPNSVREFPLYRIMFHLYLQISLDFFIFFFLFSALSSLSQL